MCSLVYKESGQAPDGYFHFQDPNGVCTDTIDITLDTSTKLKTSNLKTMQLALHRWHDLSSKSTYLTNSPKICSAKYTFKSTSNLSSTITRQ
ncbi:hypothetical protein L596_027116 [Steinernema carpocapsae]|uniref:Uncharacterized protein n=1 Tax=Steinernema carpocapsae TaxID=34508 RepID=A0A4U5M3D2_STECR|nr:hypothetical protein L596_027116 [Steinernema carpocapsae]